jgi:hypothetical protein
MPEDGGDLLLNLVKEALVNFGFAVKATGPSTFFVKRTGGTPSFILAQNGSVIHIRKQ